MIWLVGYKKVVRSAVTSVAHSFRSPGVNVIIADNDRKQREFIAFTRILLNSETDLRQHLFTYRRPETAYETKRRSNAEYYQTEKLLGNI